MLLACASGQAAALTATMNVGGTYDLAGNTISSTSFINDGTAHIYRVDLFTTMSGLCGERIVWGPVVQFNANRLEPIAEHFEY